MDKFTDPQPQAERINPGASAVMLSAMLLDRLSYYGFTGVLYSYVTAREQAQVSSEQFFGASSGMYLAAFTLPGLLGIVLDTMLDKRLGSMIGAALCAVGMLLVLLPSLGMLTVGLSMVAVGTSLTRTAGTSLLSYAGVRGSGGLGLPWLMNAAINVGAFLSGYFFRYDTTTNLPLLIVVASVLMSLQGGLVGLGMAMGLIKADHASTGQAPRSMGMTLGGIGVVFAAVLFAISLLFLSGTGLESDTRRLLFDLPLQLVIIAASIGVIAVGRTSSTQLVPLFLGGACLTMIMFTTNLAAELVDTYRFYELWGENYYWLQTLPVLLIAGTIGGVLLAMRTQPGKLVGVGVAVVVGVLLLNFGSGFGLGLGSAEPDLLLVPIAFTSIAEALWWPGIWGAGLTLVPKNRAATLVGFFILCVGFGNTLSNSFESLFSIRNGGESILGTAGLLAACGVSAILAILLALSLARASRTQGWMAT